MAAPVPLYDRLLGTVRETDGGITQAAADARYVNVTGDTMTGTLDMQNNAIILQAPGGGSTTVGSPIGLLLSLTYATTNSSANRYQLTVDTDGHLITTLI